MFDRRSALLANLDPQKPGLEVGGGYNPIATRAEGFNVFHMDHLNKDGLVEKYRPHGDTSRIQDIDFVFLGESLPEIVGNRKFDWILASHILEHLPNIVKFLQGCAEILTDDGVLSIALPDRRHCFDYYRPVTGLASVLNAYFENRTIPPVGTVIEYIRRACALDGAIGWGQAIDPDPQFIHPIDSVDHLIHDIVGRKTYHDCHVSVFTLSSFRLLIADLAAIGLCPLMETQFCAADSGEFFIQLSKKGKMPDDLKALAAETLHESGPLVASPAARPSGSPTH